MRLKENFLFSDTNNFKKIGFIMKTKKLYVLLPLFLFLTFKPIQAKADLVCTLGTATMPYNPMYDTFPTQFASNQFNQVYSILCPAGCGNVAFVQNKTTPNALTSTFNVGTSKISYSRQFMNNIFYNLGPSATFGILAHELGHHLDAYTPAGWMDHSWNKELRADAWSGCALARAGLSTQETDVALRAIAAYPSYSHPGWQQRLIALRIGYQQCGGTPNF